MIESVVSPIFLETARKTAAKLERVGTHEAMGLAHTMRMYEAEFISWATTKPDQVARTSKIIEFLTASRLALDFLAKHAK